jgi:hypothetical protein
VKRNMLAACGLAVGFVVAANNAWAGVGPEEIWSPTAVLSVSVSTAGVSNTNHMINQSGLAAGFVSGTTNFDTYIAGTPLSNSSDTFGWAAATHQTAFTVIFDMGQQLTMNALALWGSGALDANINAFTLYASNDSTFATGVTTLGSYTVSMVRTGGTSYAPYTFGFSNATAQYLELQVTGAGGNAFTTEIGEVALRGLAAPAAVPEPASLTLLGAAMAGAAALRRRRSRRQV